MLKPKRKYWARLVHADRPCTEGKKTTIPGKAYLQAKKSLECDDVRFAYVMTTDPWGECFLEILRREVGHA